MGDYSLLKTDLDPKSPDLNLDAIKEQVLQRRDFISMYGQGRIHSNRNYLLNPNFYAFDGSLVTSIDEFKANAPEYFRRSRRTVIFRDRVHLRGGRYIISTNPTFELRQKLTTFKEDLQEGLDAFMDSDKLFYQLAIADYIKNSAITMLNAFLYEEKLGRYKFDNIIYQSLRRDAQEYGAAAVIFFYGVLLRDDQLSSSGFHMLNNNRMVFEKIQAHILDEYQSGIFSSRHLTRPEASHPLIISSAVLNYTDFGSKNIDTIIGLPSGSTELALAHAVGQWLLNKKQVQVLFFPVSLHSAKNDFDEFALKLRSLSRWSQHHHKYLHDKCVLVVDDNSSTGKTVDLVVDAFGASKPKFIDVAIAEADLVRSKLNIDNKERDAIANAKLYQHSINILPVSRTIEPKTDLKEVIERKKMLACTKSRYESEKNNFTDHIVGRLYCDLLIDDTQDTLLRKKDADILDDFRGSFLSNFYPVKIYYHGDHFESVEHAYQAMKFEHGIWDKIDQTVVDKINRRLRRRNTEITLEDLPNLFTSPQITAGTSKIAANSLRIQGFVRDDWDDVKTIIMADLLIQKFAKPELRKMLDLTGSKYLVEGNDWNDTYWGVCNGRGRNVLGRLLMIIRNIDHGTMITESARLMKKNWSN